MKIAIGSDHRGFEIKSRIGSFLGQLGHEVEDFGPPSSETVDYPDFAFAVAIAVSHGRVDRGILICGTGLGMCIAANKVPRVRAAPCHDCVTAELSRRHNDANVLCLSADMLGNQGIDRMLRLWLETPFDGGRHARRVEKIQHFEARESLLPVNLSAAKVASCPEPPVRPDPDCGYSQRTRRAPKHTPGLFQ
jgi:ribose 5-phosphate isomerase B